MSRVIDPVQLLQDFLDRVMSPTACRTYVGLVVFLGAMLIIDLRAGRGIRRYLAPGCKTDLLYMFLMVGGIYGLVQQPLLDWIDSLARHNAAFLYIDMLRPLPEAVQLVAHFWPDCANKEAVKNKKARGRRIGNSLHQECILKAKL